MDSGENKRNFGVSRSVGQLLCNGDFREKQTPYRSGYNVFIFAWLRLKTWKFLEKNSVMWYYHRNGDPPETQNKDWFVRCWHVRFVLASVHLALRCSFVMCVLRFCLFLWEEDTIRREWGWEWDSCQIPAVFRSNTVGLSVQKRRHIAGKPSDVGKKAVGRR